MLTARPHLAWALWRLPKFSATPQLGSFERTPILGVTFAFTRFYFGYFPAFFIKHLEQDQNHHFSCHGRPCVCKLRISSALWHKCIVVSPCPQALASGLCMIEGVGGVGRPQTPSALFQSLYSFTFSMISQVLPSLGRHLVYAQALHILLANSLCSSVMQGHQASGPSESGRECRRTSTLRWQNTLGSCMQGQEKP